VSANQNPSRSLAGIAGIVAIATLISKIFGLVREQALAAAFGTGPVGDAYRYAYIIPGFFFILLGGINGPFYSALVSVLSKREKSEVAPLVETLTTLVTGILLLVTVVLILFSSTFIDLVAPGLEEQVRAIAILQLQIMAPLALLSGLIGIGFGTLNASNQYWLPSISPLFSSVSIVVGIGLLAVTLKQNIADPQYIKLGAIVYAGATLVGAILQWLVQLIPQWKSGLGSLRMRFDWRIPGVKEVMRVLGPAAFSSGMLQINVATDMYFASYIPKAGITMGFASFIVLTPLGIVSNIILVPFLPIFSRLTDPENWQELKVRIRQAMILTALTMLPFSAIFTSLSVPIVRVIYERGFFNEGDSKLVAPVLVAYGLGMFFYLGRDVLVRVFYAMGDADTPFRISIGNIFLNAILDYFLVKVFSTPGLILATVGVNIISMILFLQILNRRLNGLPLMEWSLILFTLTGISFVSGLSSWGVSWGWEKFFSSSNLLLQLLQLGISILVGLLVFALLATRLNLPEMDIFISRIRQKIAR
jgi:putative peptidoglycan lipid II flippase